jgi:uncharacterized protein YlxW (UPF0749 family)
MNQVSKLLIILQLFLSIMFMAFAAAVYQTGNNWKQLAGETAQSLDVARKSLNDSQNKRTQLLEEHRSEIKAIREESQTFQAQYNNTKTRLDELQGTEGGDPGQVAKILTERDVAQAETKVASDEAAARVAEANALRDEVRKLRSQVDTLVADGRTKDDRILELTRQMAAAVGKDKVDQSTIARLAAIIRLNGLDPRAKVDPNGDLVAEGREPIELIDGVVLSSKKNGRIEYVSVSVGQDDAVEVGNRLHIYRGKKFVADIILREVTSDGAVGTVDERLRNGTIRRGDNVTSRL